MGKKELLDELVRETQRRQRRRTDLSAYDDKLKEMLDLNISLPVILDWLAKQESITTLPALRRHVVRTFGQDFYNNFLKRNGWLKTKSKSKSQQVSSKLNPEFEFNKRTNNRETQITTRLRALATSDQHRPQTARLRDIFEEVEKTLGVGISQADVLAELHQAGFNLSLPGFKSAIQRIRMERGLGRAIPRR